ncbi:hypothetical protein IWW37_002998 [Coemansia sp. RSA 2050]|nr:hypothetical protein IWW37_002998 [Coemansia sp. RSA 2050]
MTLDKLHQYVEDLDWLISLSAMPGDPLFEKMLRAQQRLNGVILDAMYTPNQLTDVCSRLEQRLAMAAIILSIPVETHPIPTGTSNVSTTPIASAAPIVSAAPTTPAVPATVLPVTTHGTLVHPPKRQRISLERNDADELSASPGLANPRHRMAIRDNTGAGVTPVSPSEGLVDYFVIPPPTVPRLYHHRALVRRLVIGEGGIEELSEAFQNMEGFSPCVCGEEWKDNFPLSSFSPGSK